MSRNIVATQKREPDLGEIIARYPDVPPLIITKIDVQRRGVHYTDRALAVMDAARHQQGV